MWICGVCEGGGRRASQDERLQVRRLKMTPAGVGWQKRQGGDRVGRRRGGGGGNFTLLSRRKEGGEREGMNESLVRAPMAVEWEGTS